MSRPSCPCARLEKLSFAAGVTAVTAAPAPVPLGVVSEGVELTNAPALHAGGVTGTGVKVVVVDVGFKGYSGSWAPSFRPPYRQRTSAAVIWTVLPPIRTERLWRK